MTTAAEALTGRSGTAGSGGGGSGAGGAGGGNPAGGGGAANDSSAWLSSIQDTGIREWASSKNFPGLSEALTSYRNLEQTFGEDRAGRTAILPKDDNDAEGWAKLAERLGVPKDPSAYKLPLPEGVDDGFAKEAASAFHKAGIPPRQATQMAEWWNNYMAQEVAKGEQADRAAADQQMAELNKQWGHEAQKNNELAMRGLKEFAQRFGIEDSEESIRRMQSTFGAANLAKFFYGLGAMNSEAGHVGDAGGGGTFGVTPKQAQAEIARIQADRMSGKITDAQWQKESFPRIQELVGIASRGVAA